MSLKAILKLPQFIHYAFLLILLFQFCLRSTLQQLSVLSVSNMIFPLSAQLLVNISFGSSHVKSMVWVEDNGFCCSSLLTLTSF